MIKSVSIAPWCIACKNCESICPNIFKVDGKSMVINHNYKENIQKILKARDMCPVQVIKVEAESGANIDTKPLIWKVLSKVYLTPDTIELVVETKNFSFEAWQYINLKMKDKKWVFNRSYSIATGNENSFTLTIKILQNGRWWLFINALKENQNIEFFGPEWTFILQKNSKPKVFIATGTGLAPMIAMLENTPENIAKTVIFWVRHEQDLYYLDILSQFKNTTVITTVSKPDKNYVGKTGRVTDFLSDIKKESEIYICGNPDMVESVKSTLEKEWFSNENIFHESFVSAQATPSVWFFENIFVEGNVAWIKTLNWFFILLWIATPFFLKDGPLWFYNHAWDIAWWSVVFVIIIRPLADLFPKLLLLRKLLIWRNGLWILSSAIILSYFGFNIYTNYSYYGISPIETLSHYFTLKMWSGKNIFPRLSEITALILFITSNNFSQKLLGKNWKRIQKLAYVYFISGWIFIYSFGKDAALYSMIIAIILYFAAVIKKRNKNTP